VQTEQLICQSNKVLGNGRIDDLHDQCHVGSQRFERSRSQEVAEPSRVSIASLMKRTAYLLCGGRWGSTEPGWHPVWDEISGARASFIAKRLPSHARRKAAIFSRI